MKFRTRGFTSLLLTLLFCVAAFSGGILYLTPRGRVANWTGWTMLGLDKHSWGAVHINACLLFLLVALLHLFFNWRIFLSYIRNRSTGFNLKAEMFVAVLLTIVLVGGTIYDLPPMSAPLALHEKIKNYWEEETPSSPAPHAEEFTLVRFANTVGLTVDDIETALVEEGFQVSDKEGTIGSLAEENEITPNQVFTAIKKHHPDIVAPGQGRGRGMGQGRGFGGQGAGKQSQGKCDSEGEEGECPSAKEGVMDDDVAHGPGRGMGMGMGMGQGRGMGRGMGPGRGMGMGQGQGGGHGEGQGQKSAQGPNGRAKAGRGVVEEE